MFEFLINIFDIFLYRPLFNFLVLLYNFLPGHDFGLAVILLTIIVRIILYPVSAKALDSQKALQKLQPTIQEIQKKYKDDKEKQAKEMFDLYKKEKINPFSSLFLALVQLPILIALYRVFWLGPSYVNANFLGLADLSKPNWVLALLAGILQFFQAKTMVPQSAGLEKKEADFSRIMQKQMLYFFPGLTVVILLNLPSAIGLYWTISGIFSIVQQYFAFKKNN